jgi:hypothetical protein
MSKRASNNEFDSLDEFFSDKLKDASMQPPERIWEQIEGSLKDDKRKRRFFWLFFCGLIFIGSSLSCYFFLFDSKHENNVKTAQIKNTSTNTKTKKTDIITYKETTKQITETQNTSTEENSLKEKKIDLVKIQLGAFKRQIDLSVFAKTGLDVKSETNDNGITKYYAEVAENQVQKALQQIKQNGFADAFIKRNTNTLLTTKDNQTENKPSVSQPKSKPILALAQNMVYESKEPSLPQPTNSNKVTIADSKLQTTQQNNNAKYPVNEGSVTTNTTPQQNQTKDNNTIKNDVANTITTNSVANSPSQNPDIAVKDSLQKDTNQTIVATNKKDSVIAKTDSIKPLVKTDSSIKEPILNRWALLLTGGPNFFLKNTQNSLFDNSGEKQPITYNTSFKVEYRLLKKIAISAGLNYSYFTAQQDATLFYFPKNLTSDFIFYSSYGPMAVDKNTMLQGYSPLAPITMFHANYSYTSKINTLQIPIEAKWYYVNGKKINLYAALGVSAMFVLSEQTKLSVIKEHFNNDLSYNQINTSKFNALLMLGLGGDIKLYKQLYFTIDGGFRYGAANLSNTSGIKTNPTYFSANGGLKIKL